METTELTIRLIILLIPGIIGTFFYGMMMGKEEVSDRDFLISIVLNAFITYSFTYLIFSMIGGKPSFFDALLDSSVKINIAEVMLATILAIVFAYIEAPLLRKIAKKNAKEEEKNKKKNTSIWDTLFEGENLEDKKVRLVLSNQNSIYEGYVARYAPTKSNKKEICLKDVTKYEFKSGKELENSISEIYVQIKDDEDLIIEMIR